MLKRMSVVICGVAVALMTAGYASAQTATQEAVILGIPVGTVKSRVHYALRVLEEVLAARGLGP